VDNLTAPGSLALAPALAAAQGETSAGPTQPRYPPRLLPVSPSAPCEALRRPNPTEPQREAPTFVYEVEQFCKRNFSRPIGVEDMARVARLSRYHFSRKFGSARGISPGRYLAGLRLDEATRLLTIGGLSVKEVAEQCGYRDANYFCKVFRKNFGVTPGTVRCASA